MLKGIVNPQAGAKGSVPRLAYVEGLRALAALYVVLGHVASMVDPSGLLGLRSHASWWVQGLTIPFSQGHLAVAAFIVISGFCLQWAMRQRGEVRVTDYRKFIGKRCRRILPAYYGALALSLLVAVWVTPIPGKMPFTQYLPVTPVNVAAHLLMIQNLSPAWMYKINGVMWSISIEFQLYFLFPWLGGLIRRHRGWKLLTASAIFAIVVALAIPHGLKLYPWFLGLFLIGMVGADACVEGRRPTVRWSGLFDLGCLTSAIALALGWLPWVSELGVGVATLSALALGLQARSPIQPTQPAKRDWMALLEWEPLVVVGSFSYSLYLIHHPIMQVVEIFRPRFIATPGANLIYLTVIGLPLILAGSYAFACQFERAWVRPLSFKRTTRIAWPKFGTRN